MLYHDKMETIGPYQIEKRLGGGDYSRVYLCSDGKRPVVVKIFSTERRKLKRKIKKGEYEFIDRLKASFLDELALTAQLKHPHIVEVIDKFLLTDGTPYFVMPYFPHDLATELWGTKIPQDRGKTIEPDRVISMLKKLHAALTEIHQNGIVHRDIKPQNILLDDQGNAVLCDFGHARNPVATSPLIKTNFGTPPFVSPEQREKPSTVDGRADIYSLGVLANLMLTGKYPGDDLKTSKTLDPLLSTWIRKALDPNPAKRSTTFL